MGMSAGGGLRLFFLGAAASGIEGATLLKLSSSALSTKMSGSATMLSPVSSFSDEVGGRLGVKVELVFHPITGKHFVIITIARASFAASHFWFQRVPAGPVHSARSPSGVQSSSSWCRSLRGARRTKDRVILRELAMALDEAHLVSEIF